MRTGMLTITASSFLITGCAGMAPIKSDLEAFEASSKAANVFIAERGTRRVRASRSTLLSAHTSQSPGEEKGLLMPLNKDEDLVLWEDRVRGLARDTLCAAQQIRFDGADQTRATLSLAEGLSAYNYKSSNTISGNFKVLTNPNKPPVFPVFGLNEENQPQNEAANAEAACNEELDQAYSAFETRSPSIKESNAATLAGLTGSFNETVKPKVVALLDLIVSLRQRSRLNDYIRSHENEIDSLIDALERFKAEVTKSDVNEIRIGLVVDYLVAFDVLAQSMTGRDFSKLSPGLLPKGTVDIDEIKRGKAVLDAAAAYDKALTRIDVTAFNSLIKSVKEIKKIPDQSATTLASDARKTIQDFETAVNNLNEAFEDETFQAALQDALNTD